MKKVLSRPLPKDRMMNNATKALTFCLIIFLGTAMVNAKRKSPATVSPARGPEIEYRAPHQMIGCIEAWDTAENRRIWFRQIYTVRYDPSLERDVQNIFISGLKLEAEHQRLSIENEKGGIFTLNLETLEVQTVKGQSVVRFDN